MTHKIAILGDFNPANTLHHTVNESLGHVQKQLEEEFQWDWISTDVFNPKIAFNGLYVGLWIVPGSPYKSMEGVLNAIEYTRTNQIPTLGTCAGFQHMLIEFARNVCDIKNADHEETSLDPSELVISKLSCSLVGQEEELTIIDEESKLFKLIKERKLKGKYHCNYGVNQAYIDIFKQKGLSITVVSKNGEARAFEIKSHPFFLGTLFQIQLGSSYKHPNPVIMDFIKTCLNSTPDKQ